MIDLNHKKMPDKFTILMFNMSYYADWQRGIRNRNYFVLHELLKRDEVERVVAVDYLPMTFKRKMYAASCIMYHGPRRQEKKLNIYSPVLIRNITKHLKRTLNTVYSIHNTKHILWSYFPLYVNYFNDISADLKIFDAVDDWRSHPAYRNQIDLLNRNYQQIQEQADLIFTVSDDLRENLFNADPKAYWIANGVDLQIKNLKLKIKNSNSKFKVTIGYIGTIQSRVDFNLIRQVAITHADKEFVFVGPVWPDAEVQLVKDLPNVKFTGRVAYDKLPEYLASFNVAIIPHKIDNLTRSMNPMKYYEYLAAGLPVVTTQKIENDPGLVYVASSAEEFSQAICTALNEDSPARQMERQNFAVANSWASRVDQMMKIILNSKF